MDNSLLTGLERLSPAVVDERASAESLDAWDVLRSLIGCVEAPRDWAEEHNHYLYGQEKRSDGRRP
jgi:hypothetical protein